MKLSNVIIALSMVMLNLVAVLIATGYVTNILSLDYNGHDMILIGAMLLVSIGSITGILAYHLMQKRNNK